MNQEYQVDASKQADVREEVALVMKGGGVKGLALVGAFSELSKRFDFNAFVGTSAGAIVAALAALGSTPKQLEETLRSTDFRSFEDAGWLQRLWNLIRYQYLHPGKAFEKWLWREIKKVYTSPNSKVLAPAVEDAPNHLVMFAATAGKGLIRFDSEDEDSERRLLITFAVRASMSLPGFFKPPLLNGKGVFDGGLLANFPAKEWVSLYPDRPFMGIYLGPSVQDPTTEESVLSSTVEIVTTRDDYLFISKHRNRVVMVDPEPIETTDFGLSKQEADFLVLQGRACALEHMVKLLGFAELAADAATVRQQADSAKVAVVAVRGTRRTKRKFFAAAIFLLLGAAAWVAWPSAAELQITEIQGQGLTVGRNATLAATVKNQSSGRFFGDVRTIWKVDSTPIQDVREALDVPASQGNSEVFANHLFETPGRKIVRLEILQTSGITNTLLATKSVVLIVEERDIAVEAIPIPQDGQALFEGNWFMSFYFLGTPTDPAKPWFSWTGHLTQDGDSVAGNISSGSYVGEVKGRVEANALRGSIKFPWGDQDWWPEFSLTLSDDRKTAAGSARYEFSDARGTHRYRVEAHRLPN